METIHKTNLKKIEAMVSAMVKDHPNLVIVASRKGTRVKGLRQSWGAVGEQLRAKLKSMAVGDVVSMQTPADKTIGHFQAYICAQASVIFGAGNYTTTRTSKGGLDVMRLI